MSDETGHKVDKADAGKDPWDLLPWRAVREVVRVLDYGARKYAPDNWRKVPEARRRYFAAALRHLYSWFLGEDTDPESGLPHLAHATCCLLFLGEVGAEHAQLRGQVRQIAVGMEEAIKRHADSPREVAPVFPMRTPAGALDVDGMLLRGMTPRAIDEAMKAEAAKPTGTPLDACHRALCFHFRRAHYQGGACRAEGCRCMQFVEATSPEASPSLCHCKRVATHGPDKEAFTCETHAAPGWNKLVDVPPEEAAKLETSAFAKSIAGAEPEAEKLAKLRRSILDGAEEMRRRPRCRFPGCGNPATHGREIGPPVFCWIVEHNGGNLVQLVDEMPPEFHKPA